MLKTLDSTKPIGLVANIVISVGSVLLINGAIFGFGWNKLNDDISADVPVVPGYLIGSVWIVLFALMGTARWKLNQLSDEVLRQQQQRWIVFLMFFCWIYPLYSLAINSRLGGLLGNLATIALALFVVLRVRQSSPIAAMTIVPVILWVSLATVLSVAAIRSIGL